jgi:hypothetical protein
VFTDEITFCFQHDLLFFSSFSSGFYSSACMGKYWIVSRLSGYWLIIFSIVISCFCLLHTFFMGKLFRWKVWFKRRRRQRGEKKGEKKRRKKHGKLQLMMITISGCDACSRPKELLENKIQSADKKNEFWNFSWMKRISQQSATDGEILFSDVYMMFVEHVRPAVIRLNFKHFSPWVF